MNKLVCFCLVLGTSLTTFGQANFRSNGTGGGPWNQNATWQVEMPNGSGNWIGASSTPTSAINTIIIRAGDAVTVTAPESIDQTLVVAGASLTVNDAVSLTLQDGVGTDLFVFGTLNMIGESFLTGPGTVTISTNAFLTVGSLNASGAIASGTTSGNIRVVGRGYASTAQITYNGTGPQFIGAGHPVNAGTLTVINNSSGVTLNNPGFNLITIGALSILAGDLFVETNSLRVLGDMNVAAGTVHFNAMAAARTFTVNGNMNMTGGTFAVSSGTGSAAFTASNNLNVADGAVTVNSGAQTTTFLVTNTLNLGTNDLTLSSGAADLTMTIGGDVTGAHVIQALGANTNMVINGTGSLTSTFPFGVNASFEQLTWNRTGGTLAIPYNVNLRHIRLTAGTIDANTNLVVTGDVSLDAGTTFSFRGQTLTLQDGAFNFYLTGGVLDSDNTSILNVSGSGPFGTLAFAGGGNNLNTLTVNRPTAGPLVFLNSALTVTSAFNLTDGDFVNTSGLVMGSGSTITRNSNASMTGAAPTGGVYHVILNGLNLTTGSEVGGPVGDLTSNCSGSVAIGTGGFTASGLVTINSGTMTCAGNSISAGSLVNQATLNAPSANLTITSGNFTNNGTFNKNNGTIIFNGNSSILGSSSSVFQTVIINGSLNGGVGLSLHGNFTNNGVFNGGSSVVQFLGGTAQAVNGTMPSAFASFTVNKIVGVALTISSPLSVSTGVTLSVGTLNNAAGMLSMASASVFTRASGTTYSGLAPAGGPYNLIYNGTSVTSSGESQGSLTNVTTNLTLTLTIGPAMTVPGTFTLNSGVTSNPSGNLIMGNGATIARNGAATFTGTAPAGGPYDVVYAVSANSNTGQEARGSLRNVTNNSLVIVTINTATTIPGILTLNSGTISNPSNRITMGNGATITRHSLGAMTGSTPQGGPYNLIYNGTSLTTQVEAQGSLSDITSNLSGTGTQASGLTATGTLFVNSGTWTCGANTLNIGALSIDGTLTAPSTTLTITGDIDDDGIFQSNGGTVVFNGTTSLTGTSVTAFNHIQVNSSRTLTFPALVIVEGDMTFASGSTFNHGSGQVHMMGSNDQDINGPGVEFYQMNINKSGGEVFLLDNMRLANVLSFASATVFNSDGFLTVLSQPAGPGDDTGNDGSIGSLASGGSVSGNVTVQRFMLTKGLNNKYVSAPVSGVMQADISDDMTIQSGYVRLYNEPSNGVNTNGYFNLTSGDYPLTPGRGYLVFLSNGTNIMWDVLGQINSGDVPLPVSYTNSTPTPLPVHDGWNLVGNPYPSPIQWNSNPAAWTRSNVDPVATVYESVGTSIPNGGSGITTNFYTCNFTNGSGNLPNGIIAAGQAFWVHLSAAGSLMVHEPAKDATPGGRFLREGKPAFEQLTISFSGPGFVDYSFLVLDAHATNGFDKDYDGLKFKNEHGGIYFVDAAERHLVMNTTDQLDSRLDIPLGVFVGAPAEYRISFSGVDKFSQAEGLYFVDRQEGVAIPVIELVNTGYPVELSELSGEMNERFYLSYSSEIKGKKRERVVVAYPNPTKDFLTIESGASQVMGVMLYDARGNSLNLTPTSSQTSIDMRGYPNGIYFLRIATPDGVIVKKIFKTNQ